MTEHKTDAKQIQQKNKGKMFKSRKLWRKTYEPIKAQKNTNAKNSP